MNKTGNVILTVFVWLFVAFVVVSIAVCVYKYKNKTVNSVSVQVVYPQGKCMITDSIIKNYLSKEIHASIGKHLSNYNDSIFVNKLMKIGAVKNIHISSTINGTVILKIEQKDPYARVILKDLAGYYITTTGNIFYSPKYFGKYRLLFVDGISEKDMELDQLNYRMKNLTGLLSYMDTEPNSFLYHLTDTVLINDDDEMVLKTFMGEQPVIIGDTSFLNRKSYNLRMFYEAMKNKDVSKYRTFNLKFNNQVVAILK